MVITISRQYGSQGHDIGIALAEKLGIDFYDKELLTIASRRSGISEEYFERFDEKAANSLLYTLSIGASAAVSSEYGAMPGVPVNEELYLMQHKIIREIAEEPCVIVGRCADYILSDRQDCVRLFICADSAVRAARVAGRLGISQTKADALIRKTDKQRANYYNYYADSQWGDPNQYDLCINTSSLTVEDCVTLITAYLSCRGFLPPQDG